MSSPTSRSLALLRRQGFQAAVVEKWLQIPDKKIRSDLWKFGDVLAVHPVERKFLIVQATSRANISSRLVKARQLPELGVWLRAGGEFEVWGWALVEGRWRVKRVAVQTGDVVSVLQSLPRKRPRSRWQPGCLFGDEEPGHPIPPIREDDDPTRNEPSF